MKSFDPSAQYEYQYVAVPVAVYPGPPRNSNVNAHSNKCGMEKDKETDDFEPDIINFQLPSETKREVEKFRKVYELDFDKNSNEREQKFIHRWGMEKDRLLFNYLKEYCK